MDILEFLARSEWPIVVGVSVWLLRRSLRDMLNRINPTKLDAFGVKAGFESTLDKVEQLTPPDEKDLPILRLDNRPLKSADLISASPEAVILDSWRQLEKPVKQNRSPSNRKNLVLPLEAQELKDLKFSDDEIAAYASLRKLRNQVAHSETPASREEAIRFKEATERLLQRLAD